MKYQDDTDPGTSEVRDTAVERGVGGGRLGGWGVIVECPNNPGHMTEVKIHSV